ncbi:MOSC N-terminal beta barrel domain containing protein [Histomonas meleagridis]|uniref:MOSC N-terminal beta barrel domain containing protein n=1 Tax=Histomonas meleagridis TaxID=135588 RepID=UPI0035596246|nr:MOSC N-terminal beta barrel domain containing protein [Histomonas meleagridis]KAH0803507.1 MOSC N-terminal beta barrel domain containing protein [Histomonas meleagridis]
MFEDLRNFEFPQLNTGTFADFGGSFPMSKSVVNRINEYSTDLFALYPIESSGNSKIEIEIEDFKTDLLSLFHTNKEEYTVFFSSNTSAAIRFLGFAFPWDQGSRFIYHIDAHNSILGIRKITAKRNGEVNAVGSFPKSTGNNHSLFAFSPQSNFNGKKYPLDWIEQFQNLNPGKSHVLIDCAAYSPTCDLDLSKHKPEFIVISLLKMFGSNGGALIVKNTALDLIKEVPSIPYDPMSIVGAYAGLRVRKSFENALGTETISQHVYNLASTLFTKLKSMKHYNGAPLVRLYPDEFKGIEEQGGTIAFNLFDSKNNPISHDSIFTVATADSIFLRFGVHCNPGATYTNLGWAPNKIELATRKHEAACSLTASIIDNIHVGTIRVSFGYISNMRDVDKIASFFESHFIEKEPKEMPIPSSFELDKVFIHPIKGCQGVEITSDTYRFVRTGLIYDENWGIADELSTFLDRNRCPLLATLRIEINDNLMTITSLDGRSLTISLHDRPKGTKFTSSTVCHEKINGAIYDQHVNQWFTDVLGQKAVLVRLDATEMKPFRCFFTSSLESVGCTNVEQLRPHFIFKSNEPFEEDVWAQHVQTATLGDDLRFDVSGKLLLRTEAMIDCETGKETSPLLHSICLLHGGCAKPTFGIELVAQFVPSRKNPKELKLNSVLK